MLDLNFLSLRGTEVLACIPDGSTSSFFLLLETHTKNSEKLIFLLLLQKGDLYPKSYYC